MLSLKLPQLLRVHQVPRVFWEEGIMSGYRCPTSSALDCVLSSFQMTNETVNIWTHFLPTWFPELENPGLSKVLRTAAFAYPFLFDNLPLFYRPVYQSAWRLGASTILATATSCSTSVQCWAPTSSWKPCWLIWGPAEAGWPCRNPPWAWRPPWPP